MGSKRASCGEAKWCFPGGARVGAAFFSALLVASLAGVLVCGGQATAAQSADQAQTSTTVLPQVTVSSQTETPYQADSVIVVYKDTLAGRLGLMNALVGSTYNAQVLATSDASSSLGGTIAKIDVPQGSSVEETLNCLNEDPAVAYAQPNYIYRLVDAPAADEAASAASLQQSQAISEPLEAATVNDPYANILTNTGSSSENQYYLDKIKAFDAWGEVTTGGSQTVVVMDTGINFEHRDLKNNIDAEHAWQVTYDSSYQEIVSCPYTESESSYTYAHGTHVAGIAAAEANNGQDFAGVSYNADILPIKVFFDYGTDVVTDDAVLIVAYQYLFDLIDAGADDIHVVNLSLGGDEYDAAFEAVLSTARSQYNILTVCAAGNDGATSKSYPSDYETCLAVTATDSNDRVASWSDHNDCKDIAAPGTGIWSTYIRYEDATWTLDGTSMAAPMVSGAAALLWAKNPTLSVDDVVEVLCSTADDLGAEGYDEYYGWGRLNMQAALLAASGVTVVAESPTYNGQAQENILHVKDEEGAYLVEGVDYSVSYANALGETVASVIDAGTYTATVAGMGAWEGRLSRTVTFEVAPVDIASGSVSIVGGSACEYTGQSVRPSYTLLFNGSTQLVEEVDYMITTANDIAVTEGTENEATAYIEGLGNFTGAIALGYQIERASLNGASMGAVAAQIYDGTAHKPLATVSIDGRELVSGTDFRLAYSNNVNAGTATVSAIGMGNYKDSITGSFAINARSLTGAGIQIAEISAQRYSGVALTPAVELEDAALGKSLVLGQDYICSYYSNVEVGTASVLIIGINNYSGTVSKNFEISLDAPAGGDDTEKTMTVYAGADRYVTFAAIAQDLAAAGHFSGVIVASAEEERFADALAGSGLSGVLGYPVVLVNGSDNALNASSASALAAIAGSSKLDVVVLGGEMAVSADIARELAAYDSDANVVRVAGEDRYETALAIYEYGSSHGTWNSECAFVASGANFPDALAVGSYCAANAAPLLLVDGLANTVSPRVLSAAQSCENVVVAGGEAAVSAGVYNSLSQAVAGKIERVSGKDRYETALKVVQWELSRGMSLDGAGFATGQNFPDALGCVSSLAKTNSVLLLVSPDDAQNSSMLQLLAQHASQIKSVRVFGGDASVSTQAREAICSQLGGTWQQDIRQ